MIKLRLHGEPGEEMEKTIEVLKKNFEVLYQSSPAKDRGISKYCRVYLEVQLKPKKK